MKRFLLFLLLASSAYGQAPILRSTITTNALAPQLIWDTTNNTLKIRALAGETSAGWSIFSNVTAKAAVNINGDGILRNITMGNLVASNIQANTGFQLVPGAVGGYVLTSDGSGIASWSPTV